ncbi:MAG: DUF2188 domain-containing protein [Rhodospirillaceae bacterium]
MPDSKRIHVVKQGDDWALKREGAGRASALFDTKAEAVQSGADRARAEKGQLIVHKETGAIQEERTYRKDPFPPPG